MKRYCINFKEENKQNGRKEIPKLSKSRIKVHVCTCKKEYRKELFLKLRAHRSKSKTHRVLDIKNDAFAMYRLQYKELNVFDETELQYDLCNVRESFDIDIYLHTYYTLLYNESEKSKTELLDSKWAKDKRDEFKNKRENYRDNNRKNKDKSSPQFQPFEIREEITCNQIYIPDFAPNLIRFYYMNSAFRNIFKQAEKEDKYKYNQIKDIVSEYKKECKQGSYDLRKEERWLLERLLGCKLAYALYSFFSKVFHNSNIQKKEYKNIMTPMIEEILKYPGVYGRCAIVPWCKSVYELIFDQMKEPIVQESWEELISSPSDICFTNLKQENLKENGKYLKIDIRGKKSEEKAEQLEAKIIKILSENVLPPAIAQLKEEYLEREKEYWREHKKMRSDQLQDFDKELPCLILSKSEEYEIENNNLYAKIQKIVMDNLQTI